MVKEKRYDIENRRQSILFGAKLQSLIFFPHPVRSPGLRYSYTRTTDSPQSHSLTRFLQHEATMNFGWFQEISMGILRNFTDEHCCRQGGGGGGGGGGLTPVLIMYKQQILQSIHAVDPPH